MNFDHLKNKKKFVLIDCNNFFASCERAFDPKIRNKPVVVLSNNDGCVIARSPEAKKIGIPMGAPAHKFKNLFDQHNVTLRSANFQLYGDISGRIMSILKQYSNCREIYSIDEAFLDITNQKIKDLNKFGKEIRQKILKWTGIYVSVGIAPSKTLAKIANEYSKGKSAYQGVLSLMQEEVRYGVLKNIDVRDVWGVGYKYSEFLYKNGIYTAYDLGRAEDRWVKKNMSVVGQRTALELKGIACIEIDSNPESKKMIMSSRSFGKPVTSYSELKESVACYIERATEKLRSQNSVCSTVGVSIITNRHKENDSQYYGSDFTVLSSPTSYIPDITAAAFDVLSRIYKENYRYKKSSVFLGGIVPAENAKISLVEPDNNYEKKKKIMNAFDTINSDWGRDSIKLAATGITRPWQNRRELVSPRYTTNLDELVVAKC